MSCVIRLLAGITSCDSLYLTAMAGKVLSSSIYNQLVQVSPVIIIILS